MIGSFDPNHDSTAPKQVAIVVDDFTFEILEV
jgi:hypothetical protein